MAHTDNSLRKLSLARDASVLSLVLCLPASPVFVLSASRLLLVLAIRPAAPAASDVLLRFLRVSLSSLSSAMAALRFIVKPAASLTPVVN